FTSLTHLAAGYAMGRFVPEFREAPWWATSMLLAVASSVTMLLQATVGELIGLDTLRGPSVGTIMMLVGLVNLALAPAALAAVRWARHGAGSSRRSSTSVYASARHRWSPQPPAPDSVSSPWVPSPCSRRSSPVSGSARSSRPRPISSR